MTQNTNPPTPEGPAHRFANHPGGPSPSTHPGAPANEAQWQAARSGTPDEPASAAGQEAGDGKGKGDGRPSNLVLAGAGSLLAVLAFLGGTAVGHAWDGSSTQQNQFGGPGGGGRQFPGQQGQQGQVPGQGTNGQGQGTTGQGQGSTGQGQGSTGQNQGTLPGQGQGQGTVPGQGNQPSTGTGQTQTS